MKALCDFQDARNAEAKRMYETVIVVGWRLTIFSVLLHIVFPFLFGIMFGDFGHGLMLAMFGYFLISKEPEWGSGAGLNDMVQMCYGGRYIILRSTGGLC